MARSRTLLSRAAPRPFPDWRHTSFCRRPKPAILVLRGLVATWVWTVTGVVAAAACPQDEAIARLVVATGDVRVNGLPLTGELPDIPLCAGDEVTVTPEARASLYLLTADTPLRLDQETTVRLYAPPDPASGLIEVTRGAIYFLSEVRRTLTVRTPYSNAGIEGTEVYLRVADGGTEMIVLEGRVGLQLPERSGNGAPGLPPVTTGERVVVDAAGAVTRATLPGDGPFGALRRVAVGQLSWALYYPEMIPNLERAADLRVDEAARLLAVGQVAPARVLLDTILSDGPLAGLRDTLLATIAFASGDAQTLDRLASTAISAAPELAAPRMAQSYARQLALDLDGALAEAMRATILAPSSPLPWARVAEIQLMRGHVRAARTAAQKSVDLGGGVLADIVQGFALLATSSGAAAEQKFRQALKGESQNPLALQGLGLAQIRQGNLVAGTTQIELAVLHDPQSSLLRSYLGRSFFQGFRLNSAAKQYAIAKALDPNDPTPWFYDGIRQQIQNRPIQALHDVEHSILLNDNRAPFRSRLLLDEDLASRGTSLGRIYDDLGFRQLGINEASKSLAANPASAAAHRFLGELYDGQPRLEAARLSALLQAQLLQPVGMNPVQPSLAFSNLGVLRNSGPSSVGFNEFNRVFQQNGLQFDSTSVSGTNTTLGNEVAISGLANQFAFSLGQLYYQTDGTHENDYLKNQIYTALAQIEITEDLNVQITAGRRNSDRGDREQSAINKPDPNLRIDRDESFFIVGGKLSLSPNGTLLFAAAHGSETLSAETSSSISDIRSSLNRSGEQIELQYIHDYGTISLVGGGGAYDTSGNLQFIGDNFFGIDVDSSFDASQNGAFGYSYINMEPYAGLTLTTGLAFERYDEPRHSDTRLLPKLGIVWSPKPWLTFRGAAFDSLNRGSIAEQTLEPVQIAGFSQFVDAFPGSRARTYAVGIDLRPSADLAFGIEAGLRKVSPPTKELSPITGDGETLLQDHEDSFASAYAYYTPTSRLALTASFGVESFHRESSEAIGQPAEVDQYVVPLSVRYFHPNGVFGSISATFLHQIVGFEDNKNGVLRRDNRRGNILSLDSVAGWRLFDSRFVFSVEGYNLLDQKIDYQDSVFRIPAQASLDEQPLPFFVNSRTVLVRLTLEFGT